MTAVESKGIRCYRIDGKLYPSVSAGLDLCYPSSSQWVDQAALDRGSACHAWMATWLQDWSTKLPAEVELRHRCQRASTWVIERNIVATGVEVTRQSKYGFAGTCDLIGRTHAECVLGDFKFAEALSERYTMQILAYRILFPEASVAYLIQVPAVGAVRAIKVKSNPRLWSVFLSAVNVLNFRLVS